MNKKSLYIKYCYQVFFSIFIICGLCSCTLLSSLSQLTSNTQTSQKYENLPPTLSSSLQSEYIENIGIATIFTETFKATLEEVLDASLNHISSHYFIEEMYIDKQNLQNAQNSPKVHVIKASFITNKPHNVLDCGSVEDEALLPDGTRFSYVYQGADSPVFTMEKRNGEYKNASKSLDLNGEITLTIQEISSKKISVNVLTKYILKQKVVYTPLKNTRTLFRENTKEEIFNEMQFYTGETGVFYQTIPTQLNNTQNIDIPPLPVENSVQCQAKANIEESILEGIAKHLN